SRARRPGRGSRMGQVRRPESQAHGRARRAGHGAIIAVRSRADHDQSTSWGRVSIRPQGPGVRSVMALGTCTELPVALRSGPMKPYVIPWMDDDLEVFRDTVVRFVETEMVPHDARWREQHHVDRETWRKAGDTG